MNTREVCRLLLNTDLSSREVGRATGVAGNTAARYRARLTEEELDWPAVSAMTDRALEDRLNNGRQLRRKVFDEPDFSYVHAELRKTGVTLLLLHDEYASAAGATAMSETEFRRRYRRYQRSLGIVMRQPHAPGYQIFLDYSGKRPTIFDRTTGEHTPVELFVAVMGASRKTFAYATATQSLPDWCEANVRALEFFGGVAKVLTPDNLKAAVDRLTPKGAHIINYTYAQLARHYECIVLPTRPRHPKDKAPVEVAVRIAQRWILAKLRNRVFTSIEELNAAIAELLVWINNKPMRGHGNKSRNELFDELDRPALKPLPELPFRFVDWHLGIRVPMDYHVAFNQHYYSVPYTYVGSKVRLGATATQIEIYADDGQLPIATHLRNHVAGECTTNREHQPAAHRAYSENKAKDLVDWASQSGAGIKAFADRHIEVHRRPAISMQALRGLRTLAKEYGVERVNMACQRALKISAMSTTSIRSMLQKGLESAPVRGRDPESPPAGHSNIRGATTYSH